MLAPSTHIMPFFTSFSDDVMPKTKRQTDLCVTHPNSPRSPPLRALLQWLSCEASVAKSSPAMMRPRNAFRRGKKRGGGRRREKGEGKAADEAGHKADDSHIEVLVLMNFSKDSSDNLPHNNPHRQLHTMHRCYSYLTGCFSTTHTPRLLPQSFPRHPLCCA